MMRLAVIAFVVLSLSSCWVSQSRSQYRVTVDTPSGPVSGTISGAETSDSGVDAAAVVQAAVAAVRGDVARVYDAVQAKPPPEPDAIAAAVVAAQPKPEPTNTTPLIAAGGTAAAALIAAMLQARQRAAEHKADADEAWARLLPPQPKAIP